jgi:RNA polymerase sigma factor (sigma-70 family)
VLDSDDVLQVTCMEAFLDIGRFSGHDSIAFFGWLLRIAQNNIRDAIRSLDREKREPRKRRVAVPHAADSYASLLANLAGTDTTPSGVVAREEMTAALQAAIGKLPEHYQKVVQRIDLEGCSTKAVATEIGRSLGAVHMLRQRAHDHLARLMGDSTKFFSAGRVKADIG